MLKVDPTSYNPDPNYLRALLESAGLSQRQAARLVGEDVRRFRYYLDSNSNITAPYSVQFALEFLAHNNQ